MLYRSSSLVAARRPGVVLLVVMALLALFATVGLSFVFYADGEAYSAKLGAQSLVKEMPEVDPEDLAAFFLNQMIYDTNNQYSALRGWSLARSIYGYNPTTLNITPYNGAGRASFAPPAGTPKTIDSNLGLDPNLGISMFGAINYQTFWDEKQAAKYNVVRTPEYYGSARFAAATGPAQYTFFEPGSPNTYRYVGGANAPWTAYDTNSLFLAQVGADGTVYMPSFGRPWLASAAGPTAKYTSVFIDQTWNPSFYNPLPPDADIVAQGQPLPPQVKNLEFGPGMKNPNGGFFNNDSYWMDVGFPVMTAPNGKRYKPLVATLAMDLSNRLHLWAHGNQLGTVQTNGQISVSNQGFGPPEVNLSSLPGNVVTNAVEKGATVTITTVAPHQLVKGQYVIIRNMPAASVGFNGMYAVKAVPTATTFTYADTTKKLTAYAGGANPAPTALSVTELQSLYAFRYGPPPPLPAGGPVGLPQGFRPGTWFSLIDADGLDPLTDVKTSPTRGMSSPPPYMASAALMTQITGAGAHPFQLLAAFPVPVQVGTAITVSDANTETVAVTVVNSTTTPPTYTAKFKKPHAVGASVAIAAGTPIVAGSPYMGFPTYPVNSWLNASPAGELTNKPLAFNPFFPNTPNLLPLPMSNMEALLRFGGTNSPALTSEVFRRMPTTFSNPRARMMATLANWDFDRVKSAPYLNFNSLKTPQYGMVAGYPSLGINEVQTVTVTGRTPETFTLTFGGKTTKALKYNATAAQVQKALQALATIGAGNALVAGPVGTPTVYTVTFAGTLANVDMPPLTGASANGATVTVKTLQNGQPPAPPNPAVLTSVAVTTPNVYPPNSDFSADWRSTLSQALRVDLTRTLPDYPAPGAKGVITNTAAGSPFDLAQKARQQFATDIYRALVRATGARDPNVVAGMVATNPDYQAARWLAQLAVNIVDFIDDDDYMTPFVWNVNNATEVLFGTELPRLVLNEAYAQQQSATTPSAVNVGGQVPIVGQVNVWAELLNPFKSYAAGTYTWSPTDNGTAVLQQTGNVPYIIEIHASGTNLTTALSSPNNPTGAAPPLTLLATQNNWGNIATTMQVPPANPANRFSHGGTIFPVPIDAFPPAKAKGPFGASIKGTTVTIHTAAAHKLTNKDVGKAITINGVTAAGYDGTFVITSVTPPTTFTYTVTPVAAAALAANATSGNGTAMYVETDTANGNYGFYVIAPSTAQYATASQAPNLPATYASPWMSFANSSATINAPNAKAALTGASYIITPSGATVTIETTAPLPPSFAVGEPIVISGVTTTNAKGVVVPTPVAFNNNTIAAGLPVTPPSWTITAIAGNTLTFTIPLPWGTAAALGANPSGSGTVSLAQVTLMLRRLANPHLAMNPITNPYITVDYLDQIPVNTLATTGVLNTPATLATVGRTQPYAANASYRAAISPNNPITNGNQTTATGALPLPNAPLNTFFYQNSNAPGPFDWLVHLDRPPVNPIELLHVSGFRPHELTQQFVTTSGKFQHYAPWNPFASSASMPYGTMADPNALIYRALDQMSTRYMAGLYAGGRIPGNINLNTITEPEIFQALCDAHDSSTTQYPNPWFTQPDVANPLNPNDPTTVLGRIFQGRGVPYGAAPTSEPTPFKSFSAASTLPPPPAVGTQVSFNDTWFRPGANGRPLFVPQSATLNANAHPYLQSSLLQKIYNNTTTTSNVFAVWFTVGFFEVVDESVMPPRLGQEIGRNQNRHIRHRFFAVVDRSGLQLFNTTFNNAKAVTATQNETVTIALPAAWNATTSYAIGATVSVGQVPYIAIQSNINNQPNVGKAPAANTGTYWQKMLQPGMLLEIDSGTAFAEVVTVTAVANNQITATFAQAHSKTATVICRGNPGPRMPYNPRDDTNVVLHLSVIK